MPPVADQLRAFALRVAGLSLAIAVIAFSNSPAAAQCVVSGTTVTCSGTTFNPAGNGFGDGTQVDQTIDVLSGATVRGNDHGIAVDTGNVVNNRGAVTGDNQDGINAFGSIVVNNFAGASITGAPTIGGNGILAGGDITLNNAGSIYGGRVGVWSLGGTINAINSGTISSDLFAGIHGDAVNLTNSGVVTTNGFVGVLSNTDVTVFNTGTISGPLAGIAGGFGATYVVNSGVVSGGFAGIDGSGGPATIVNSGTIAAPLTPGTAGVAGAPLNLFNTGTIVGDTAAVGLGGGSNIVNAGWLIGSFSSIDLSFFGAGGDTITLLPGSRLVGSVEMGFGAPSTVNIVTGRDIGWLVTFGACGCGGIVENQSIINITGGAPAVVVGNQIATLDPTVFGQADKNLLAYTSWISSLLVNRRGDSGPVGAAFAALAPAENSIVAAAHDAFASVLPAAYASDKGLGMLPNTGAVYRESGTAVWAGGFGGFRHQNASGPMLGSSANGYGGAFGIDGQVRSDLRLGVFFGAGEGRFNVDLGSQSIDSNYIYGGVYGRFEWISHFLDWSVQVGRSGNDSQRLVANNMVAGGLETATASYDGWYVTPEIAYGVRLPVNANMTLTPTARVRYLAGDFDGYNEAGSAQTLSVGKRNLQNLEERFELALTLYEPMSAGIIKTTATVGALAQQRIGDKSIGTVLIGQDLVFATPGENSVFGGFAGLGFDYRITSSANVYGGVEATIADDKSRTGTARGGVRVRF